MFKASLKNDIKNGWPLALFSAMTGILITRTLFIGSATGLTLGYYLKPFYETYLPQLK